MLVQTQCMAQVALYRKVSVTNRQKEKKMSHTPSRASIRSAVHCLNEPPSHMLSSYFTRSHVPHVPHVPLALWRHGWRHPLLTRLSRLDPDRPRNLTRSEPPQKKKKKERENALTKQTFDLDQKVKIFKTDLSHSIFRVHFDFGTYFFIRSSEIA